MDFDGFNFLIDGLRDREQNTASEVRNILRNLIQSIFLPGDIKMVYCTQEELISDYTSTGVGKGKRAGWAQCNGLEGRPLMGGRVPLGYSDKYSEIGGMGGSEKHTLSLDEIPPHDHTIPARNFTGSIGGAEFPNGGGATVKTSSAGGGLPHNNMQPYTIVLFLIKL
ncbi:hypothetical protein [Flavobacterium sp. F52]|uniref:hypothetical protein n=1 Tax=Flavobacterium sp. F52 TaxID=1202532 RepID=UPI000272DFE4|nr:hypothetical protein [Flavobacterium sp. F52]EJG02300.1 hypothetical protein FF52_06455 [Flavobacterium sp. F52]